MSGDPSRIGTFELDRAVTRTRAAVVYLARDAGTGQAVTLHLLRPELAHDARARHALVREARLLDRLGHPCTPRVLSHGVHAGRPYYATHRLAGPTLAEAIARGARIDVTCVLRDLAAILDHARGRGVALRDLTAERVACVAHGDGLVLAVRDWTGAREVASVPADVAASVQALGVVAFQALTGVMAHASAAMAALSRTTPLASVCPRAPRPLIALLDRMLAPRPWLRPTLSEVRAEAAWLLAAPSTLYPDEVGPDDVGEVTRVVAFAS